MRCVLNAYGMRLSKALEKWQEERESTGLQLQESWREWVTASPWWLHALPQGSSVSTRGSAAELCLPGSFGGPSGDVWNAGPGTEGPASVGNTLCVFLNM